MTKEQIYDAEISPLMEQIIGICHANRIPVVASFGIDDECDLHCSTTITPKDFNPSDMLLDMSRRIQRRNSPLMVTTRDGSGQVSSITAIM